MKVEQQQPFVAVGPEWNTSKLFSFEYVLKDFPNCWSAASIRELTADRALALLCKRLGARRFRVVRQPTALHRAARMG